MSLKNGYNFGNWIYPERWFLILVFLYGFEFFVCSRASKTNTHTL